MMRTWSLVAWFAQLLGVSGIWPLRRASRVSLGITAPTHFEVSVVFRVLPDFPIVEAKAALPRFGHAQLCSQLSGFRKQLGEWAGSLSEREPV